MKHFMQKLTELVNEYNSRLCEYGIAADISRKYFETKVAEHSTSVNHTITVLDEIIKHNAKKREKKKSYDYQPNRFYCIVLKITPCEKELVPKEFCREYSFIQRSTERQYIGDSPKEKKSKEDDLLAKIEKKLSKILNKAKKHSPAEICRDTFWDIPRYLDKRYAYKSKILGRMRVFWEIIFLVIFPVILFILIFALYQFLY